MTRKLVAAKRRETQAQRAYDYVAAIEEDIRECLDAIPYSILRSRTTSTQLRHAAADMIIALGRLKAVRSQWEPVYNRSAHATTIEGKEAQP